MDIMLGMFSFEMLCQTGYGFGSNDAAEKEVIKAVDKLNSRPRKYLGYKTPYEVFKEPAGIDAREVMGYAFIT